jgi:hypothetical protein
VRGQPHESPVTLDQPMTNLALQGGNPGRQRWLRNTAFLRRIGEMPQPGNGHEIAELAGVHHRSLG